LLLGPTGAGKEVFAQALHHAGSNPTGPFIALNCGGITRDLLASELFGYGEGAFTGASRGGQIGKFEAANGGTLFLDEIGEMPIDLQSHLLRVLEEGEVYRLGENKPRKVNVRLIAATNRDLKSAIGNGQFRMDLYYRLAVTILNLPALAEHPEDIPILAQHFIDKTSIRYGVAAKTMTQDVLGKLMSYSWPGNVRELRNVIEGMMLLGQEDVLSVADLPAEILSGSVGAVATRPPMDLASSGSAGPEMAGKLDDIERDAIVAAIRAEWRNMTQVAKRLGIAKSTLYAKMKRHGLNRQFEIEGESV
jgi:transcriptional regulator with PAS, ATPase and Fis domain